MREPVRLNMTEALGWLRIHMRRSALQPQGRINRLLQGQQRGNTEQVYMSNSSLFLLPAPSLI